MRSALKFLLVLVVALLVTLSFRALVFTVCTIEGDGLSPLFVAGDRVLVNRWSYGLRTGEKGGLFDYGRICRQDIRKGDCVAFEDSLGRMLICRCAALPGDTILTEGLTICVVPGLVNCAGQNFYWMEPVGKHNLLSSHQLGFIPEDHIVGRACLVLFSRDPAAPFWKGYRSDRLLLPK